MLRAIFKPGYISCRDITSIAYKMSASTGIPHSVKISYRSSTFIVMRQCSVKWVRSSMVKVSDLWCCEAQSLGNNLPVLSTCKGSIFYGFTSAVSPLGMLENSRKTFKPQAEGVKNSIPFSQFLRLKRLCSEDSEGMC